jgi:DNA-binding PadR family transcriptional regulator
MKQEQINKLTLLLLYVNSWEEKEYGQSLRRAWKGYDFDTLNKLEEDGLITQSKTAKSLYLTDEGIAAAKQLETLLATINTK